jgi:penicillin-binding protein 1A
MTTKQSAPHQPGKPLLPPKRRFFRRFILASFLMLMILGLTALIAAVGGYQYISQDLPKINSLMDYRPPIITTVYAEDGRKIGEFFKERRIVIPLGEVPPLLVKAFIAAEDSRFFQHQGIDPVSILRAALKNLEAGTIKQGGSTITQQVTRSFLLTPERSYIRKIKEIILSYRIEKAFTKEEILFLYLNQIYLGHGAYGVQAAAENYFGKSVRELNLAECAVLAGLPQAPTRYSPFRHPEQARARQVYVLNRMVEEGFIPREQADEALSVKLDIKPRRNIYVEQVPYYTEHVRRYVEGKYGADALYNQGLQIHTAVSIEFQKIAEQEVNKGLIEIDKRQGYRGPLKSITASEIDAFLQEQAADLESSPLLPGRITQAVVTQVNDPAKTVAVRIGKDTGILTLADMAWARKPNPDLAHYEAKIRQSSTVLKPGDVVLVKIKDSRKNLQDPWHVTLEQEPLVQGAMLCLETETGLVKAMVGGRDFNETQFNRAIQSRRQPGSSFKPIIYAAALDRKFSDPKKAYTPATMIIDSAVVFEDRKGEQSWKPKNYKETFYGPTLLREALAQSRNVVTVKILQDIGVDYTIEYARKLGITAELTRTLSLALGASGVSLFELTRAYSVFANQGFLIEPVFVLKITDRAGNVLEEAVSERRKVIEKDTAFIMTNLMESVVQHGTGQRIKALGRPAAGKTGTTNDMYDAWYLGYTPEYITGVWVGFDTEAPLGKTETGAVAASPIWLGFMKQVLANESVKTFQPPDGVIFAKIDAETGLLPVTETHKTIFECFKEGTVPSDFSKRPGEVKETEDFFKKDL